MGYNDLPKIDNSAKNSETSVRKLNEVINLNSGFQCRPENPDTGVDFNVELILNGEDASNWKFPIQLKSIAGAYDTINEGKFITYPFKLSRLHYLRNSLPAQGLIVLYSDKEDKLVFDFVSEIWNRIIEERGANLGDQDSINIHIPSANILDNNAAVTIHQVFFQRFENSAAMHREQGAKYKLPIDTITPAKFNPDNIDDVKAILLKYGMAFMNTYDITIVSNLLNRLTHNQILEDEVLMQLAIVSYAEQGMYTESLMYFSKLNKKNPGIITSELTLQYSKLRSDLALANITPEQFERELDNLGLKAKKGVEKITIDINRVFHEVLAIKGMHPIPEGIRGKIEQIYEDIESSAQPENIRRMFELWNTENLMILLNSIRHKELLEFKIFESSGGKYTLEEKVAKVNELIAQEMEFAVRLDKLNTYAKDNDNKLLLAHAWALNCRGIVAKEIDYYSYRSNDEQIGKDQDLLFSNIILGLQAYNIFRELDHRPEAYHILCTAIDLIDISRQFHGFSDKFDREEFVKIKVDLEQLLDTPTYVLAIDRLKGVIDKSHQPNLGTGSLDVMKHLDDMQMESYARTHMNGAGLPESAFIHIVNEMKGYRMFFNSNAVDKLDIHLSPVNVGPGGKRYFMPSRFILKSKLTGIESNHDSDVAKLLRDWGYGPAEL